MDGKGKGRSGADEREEGRERKTGLNPSKILTDPALCLSPDALLHIL